MNPSSPLIQNEPVRDSCDSPAARTDSPLPNGVAVTLLTGGGDKPYVWGLANELVSKGATIDLIGSDELDCPEFRTHAQINFLNLRGDQGSSAGLREKVVRVAAYYARLIRYAAKAKPRIFHILWNNKFEAFDRTLLLLYYKLVGKRLVLTAHNVNAGVRDRKNTWLNRLTLRVQYRLTDHIFVHTEKMKSELISAFGVSQHRVTVIPFGINNAVPNTSLTSLEARRRLGLRDEDKVILFFGRIRPYKGLDYLIAAFQQLLKQRGDCRLLVAGRLDMENSAEYAKSICDSVSKEVADGKVFLRTEFIPDAETEVYFKAADILVLPYRHIYQSGVLFLSHSFGLPVLASDVGSLKDDVVEGENGFMFKPDDAADLAKTLQRYFASDLFADLAVRRHQIREHAGARHSWSVVGDLTLNVYADLLRASAVSEQSSRQASKSSLDAKAPL